MAVSIEELAEEMLKMVTEYEGKKNLKAGDLIKAMIAKYGEDEVSKKECKLAIRELMDNGRTVYSYFGGSYITLPKKEGAAPE
ncbi:MAG: hydantoinase B/oxoprolinase family protein [bacterium]|nr:hydantoinase B/oxoprolinase family protein [bacterium]